MANFNTRIQLKYDTYAKWVANDPVILKGELAIVEVPAESGTGLQEPSFLLKVGDGVKRFSELEWISGKAADVYSWAKAASKPTYNASEIEGLSDFIAGEIEDTDTQYQIVKNGDMGFKLQSKAKGTEVWSDVNEITLVPPVDTLVEGSANGTVAFNGTDVKVHGLGSAAYVGTETFDAAGAAETAKTQANQYTDQQIASKLSSTYKAAGSVTFEALPSLGATEEGKVYNITNAFTTNENFVEGTGKKHPAGTNVVCVNTGDSAYKWDVLAGMVDLSAYETAETTTQKIATAKQEAISAAATDATSKANTAEQNAKTYADGLKTTIDGTISTLVGSTPVSEQITDAIDDLNKGDSVTPNQFVTSVAQVNGIINVTRSQPTIANISGLQDALDLKANDADLATVAKTGKIDDLTQTGVIVFNCGDSSNM